MPPKEQKSKDFEDCIAEINTEIEKRRKKWTLSAVPSMDFDDVCQIIRFHIWKKWHLYDQSRPLVTWLNTVISHQIRNLLRNNYGRFVKPCLRCACNEGGELCSLYGVQDEQCKLYRFWQKHKQDAYNINLPVAIENHTQEVTDMGHNNVDIERALNELHEKMSKILKPLEWKVYKMLYIDHLDDAEVAKAMGYKSKQKGKIQGYRQLKYLQDSIFAKAKQCLNKKEIDSL